MPRTTAGARTLVARNNNILFNGDFEVKPGTITADTNVITRWIDGTAGGSSALAGYGWATPSSGSGVGANGSASFDTSITRNGLASMRLSNLTVTGAVTISSSRNLNVREYFPLSASKSYTLTGYIRTNNVAANGAFIDLRQFDSGGATLATTSTNKLAGTNTSFRQATLTLTTNASAVFGVIFLRNNVAGNISDAWFDDVTLSLASISRSAASSRTLVS